MLQQLQKDNEITISKYMNPPEMKYYPQMLNMKSIIKKNLENEKPSKTEKLNNNKEKNLYHQ